MVVLWNLPTSERNFILHQSVFQIVLPSLLSPLPSPSSFSLPFSPSLSLQELNIDSDEVERLLVSCILDSTIHGRIDQVKQILELDQVLQDSAR